MKQVFLLLPLCYCKVIWGTVSTFAPRKQFCCYSIPYPDTQTPERAGREAFLGPGLRADSAWWVTSSQGQEEVGSRRQRLWESRGAPEWEEKPSPWWSRCLFHRILPLPRVPRPREASPPDPVRSAQLGSCWRGPRMRSLQELKVRLGPRAGPAPSNRSG